MSAIATLWVAILMTSLLTLGSTNGVEFTAPAAGISDIDLTASSAMDNFHLLFNSGSLVYDFMNLQNLNFEGLRKDELRSSLYSYYNGKFDCPSCLCILNSRNLSALSRTVYVYHLIRPRIVYEIFRNDPLCLLTKEYGEIPLPYTFGANFVIDFVRYISTTVSYGVTPIISKTKSQSEAAYFYANAQAATILYAFSRWKRAASLSPLSDRAFLLRNIGNDDDEFGIFSKDFHNRTTWTSLDSGRLLSPYSEGIVKDASVCVIIAIDKYSDVLKYLEFLVENRCSLDSSYLCSISYSDKYIKLDSTFVGSSDMGNDEANIYVLSFIKLLGQLETALAFDITWIDTKLLFGYVLFSNDKTSIAEEVNVDVLNHSFFCRAIYLLFPALSAASDCLVFTVNLSSNDKFFTELSGLYPDVVRRQLSIWAVEDNIDFNFYLTPDIPFLREGFVRLSIYILLYNPYFPKFGCVVLNDNQDLMHPYLDNANFMLPLKVFYIDNLVDLIFNSSRSSRHNSRILLESFWGVSLLYVFQGIFNFQFEMQYETRLNCFVPSECHKIVSSPEDSSTIHAIKYDLYSNILKMYYIDDLQVLSIANLGSKANAFNLLYNNVDVKIAFITAIFGGYESSCKKHAAQDFPVDFICFTDNPRIAVTDWEVDTTPYHDLFWDEQVNKTDFDFFRKRNIRKEEIENAKNSPFNNKTPFMKAKFYKTNFHWIPRLKKYDVVVWLDGTISIHDSSVARKVYNKVVRDGRNFIVFEHFRNGNLSREVEEALEQKKYNGDTFNGFEQPMQQIDRQLEAYKLMGYSDSYWRLGGGHDLLYRTSAEVSQIIRPQRGVWVTCFLAFDMRNPISIEFLHMWYEQILFFSTQDQVSFPFVAQYLKAPIYSLPVDDLVVGNALYNEWYKKRDHGL